jgi:NAD(P)H-quinone oxidoreductase subunit 5
MGGLRRYMPITGTTFLSGTLSLCGIPPLACLWSKDETTAESWLFSSSLGWITSITAGFTASYMFRIYFLTFEGFFRGGTIQIKKAQVSESYQTETEFFLWGESLKKTNSVINKKDSSRHFIDQADSLTLLGQVVDINNETSPFRDLPFPKESSFAMLLPLILLAIPTPFVGSIGIKYLTKETSLDFLSQWLIPLIIPDQRRETLTEFFLKSIGSLSFSFVGFFLSYLIYGPNSSLAKNIFSFFIKRNFINIVFLDSFKQFVRGWSLNRGYIDKFYDTFFISNIIFVSKSITFFDRWLIDGFINGTGIFSLFGGEGIRYGGGGRVSYYLFALTVAVMLLLVLTVIVFTTT